MNVKKQILLRARIAFLGTFAFALAIVYKAVHIQLIQGDKWRKMAHNARLEYRPIKATRGNIYARDASLLATSLPFYRVAFDPCIPDQETFDGGVEALATRLADFFQDKPAAVYKKKLQTARKTMKRYVVLSRRQINHQEKKQISQWPVFKQRKMWEAMVFDKIERRFPPFKELAYRTIGFINEDSHGAGLEYSFNKYLQGTPGKGLYRKMVGGHWKMIHNGIKEKPRHGYDIETTIDINLQDVAHRALLNTLQENDADYGCAVVMEVATGEIRAIVNLGCIGPGKYTESYNFALGEHGSREPGSTFKIAALLALFEETNLQLTDKIDTGDGRYKFCDRVMKEYKRGGFGVLTVQEVIEVSSFIGTARLLENGFGRNPQKFIDYLEKLNLTKPLGLQVAGEAMPFVKTPQDPSWSGVTLPWMSSGYELKVTPLQILTLYNAIANNGIMVRPMFIKHIKYANKNVRTFSPVILNKKICSNKTLVKLRALLEGVVTRGTARSISHSYYPIAGKTGTAQKHVAGGYSKNWYTSFAGYFPANAPKYSCIVVVDNPKGFLQSGGNVAAPVFKVIADEIAVRDIALQHFLDDLPTAEQKKIPRLGTGYGEELAYLCKTLHLPHQNINSKAVWVNPIEQENKIDWIVQREVNPREIPNVIGMCLKDAFFVLESIGLNVTIRGQGRVLQQDPAPGTPIMVKGQTVTLQLQPKIAPTPTHSAIPAAAPLEETSNEPTPEKENL